MKMTKNAWFLGEKTQKHRIELFWRSPVFLRVFDISIDWASCKPFIFSMLQMRVFCKNGGLAVLP
jgi:hypothetical protein